MAEPRIERGDPGMGREVLIFAGEFTMSRDDDLREMAQESPSYGRLSCGRRPQGGAGLKGFEGGKLFQKFSPSE